MTTDLDVREKELESSSSERYVEISKKEHAQQLMKIYEEWLKSYQENNPDDKKKKKEDEFTFDGNGNGLLKFTDPNKEEDFVRHLAEKVPNGAIKDKNDIIAHLKDGKLIDPRTNKEFSKGEYAKLVQQLDAGVAYKDIPLPSQSQEQPFRMIMSPPSSTSKSVIKELDEEEKAASQSSPKM